MTGRLKTRRKVLAVLCSTETSPDSTLAVDFRKRQIEAPCSKLQGIFDPQGRTIYSNRSLTPQQATGNALAPGFKLSTFPPLVKTNDQAAFLVVVYLKQDTSWSLTIPTACMNA